MARARWRLLDDVLHRRQTHADGAEAVTVALERAQLADERLKNPERAIEILRHVLDELALHGTPGLRACKSCSRRAAISTAACAWPSASCS